MGGWGNGVHGWQKLRRRGSAGEEPAAEAGSGWSAADVVVAVIALVIHWEVAVAFVGLKLWQQASGYRGSVFAFAREKWDALVAVARSLLAGSSLPSLHVGPRSSGNLAFDRWRRAELLRIEADRDRLREAEREFAAYRSGLLHGTDHEDFDRFMQARGISEPHRPGSPPFDARQ